jgi:hypothetical protein
MLTQASNRCNCSSRDPSVHLRAMCASSKVCNACMAQCTRWHFRVNAHIVIEWRLPSFLFWLSAKTEVFAVVRLPAATSLQCQRRIGDWLLGWLAHLVMAHPFASRVAMTMRSVQTAHRGPGDASCSVYTQYWKQAPCSSLEWSRSMRTTQNQRLHTWPQDWRSVSPHEWQVPSLACSGCVCWAAPRSLLRGSTVIPLVSQGHFLGCRGKGRVTQAPHMQAGLVQWAVFRVDHRRESDRTSQSALGSEHVLGKHAQM